MTDTTDVQGYHKRYQGQLSKLETADIDDRDRDAIMQIIRQWDVSGSINEGTIANRLNRLRLSAERSDIPLVEMDKNDVDSFLFDLKHDRGFADGTLRNYRKALRRFFDERNESWAGDIHVGGSNIRSVDPKDLLTDDEIDALLNACKNARDSALIALLADSGLRIGALISLRVSDVDLSGNLATITINSDANVKDASGTIPITWSEGYVSSWLNNHPRRDVDDAALLHKLENIEDDDDGALQYQIAARQIKRLADRAGIDRDRVNTHNFRKTAISRWIREGLSEQAIKHRACWDVDTNMIKIYSGVRDEELNDHIASHYGIETPDTQSDHRLERCFRCSTPLSDRDEFCSACGAALTDLAAEKQQQATGAVRDDLVELNNPIERQVAADTQSDLESDPALISSIVDEVMDRLDSDTHGSGSSS